MPWLRFLFLSQAYCYTAPCCKGIVGVSAVCYGLSVLGLQFSLSFNCWVFACQMLIVGGVMLVQIKKQGLSEAIGSSMPLLAVCLVLFFGYVPLLAWMTRYPSSHKAPLLEKWTYWTRLADNAAVLFRQIICFRGVSGWNAAAAICLFGAGVVLTVKRNIGWAAYLMTLLFGQLAFSTYMTYSRIAWFHQRYLTSSYVAFALFLRVGL